MGSHADPEVSVLIPAYRAEGVIGECVASLLAGENGAVEGELLVESDDGGGYAALAALSERVKVGCSGAVRTGAGAARNRALARARGRFVTYVDADDVVAGDYLPRLLAAARGGAALARTEVEEGGRVIARFGKGAVDFAALGRHGASFRGVMRRDLCPLFEEDLSQDIFHLVEVMLRVGPVPVAETAYRLRAAAGSVTAAADFSQRVDAAYARHIGRLGERYPRHAALAEAQGVFAAKRVLNRRYVEEARAGESYYAFIARVLPD